MSVVSYSEAQTSHYSDTFDSGSPRAKLIIYHTDNCGVCYLLLGALRCETGHSVFVTMLHGYHPSVF